VRKLSVLLMILLAISCTPVFARDAGPDIKSASAILVHEDSGYILFEKNADEKAYPASTTKIMTAFLAIENLDPNQSITVQDSAIQIDRDGSNMGLLNGEIITVRQLLYGLLVNSANDAANVLAEAVAGDVDSFVALMNERAAALGMNGTHYVNTHGYHDSNHYTTARDLLTLSMHAMEQPLFREIVGTAIYEIPPTNKYKETRILSNNNILVNRFRDHRFAYSGAAGIKTGYTSDAGSCLSSYVERNGNGFFCVTLNGPVEAEGSYSFIDSIALFDYAFQDFSPRTVANTTDIVTINEVKWARGDSQLILSAKEPLEVLLPKSYDKSLLTTEITTKEEIVAPVKEGAVLGRLTYLYDGARVGMVDLVATRNVPRGFFKMVFSTLWNIIFSPWVITPLAVIVALLVLRSMAEARKRQRARERRRQQAREEFYRH